MPKPKVGQDGKPVLDAEGKPVMEFTSDEKIADFEKQLAEQKAALEARDAETKRLQMLNKQLIDKMGTMDVSRTVPLNAEGAPDFSKLDFVNDPNSAVKAVVEAVVGNVRHVINGQESARQQAEQLKQKFYKENPDLVGFEDVVAIQAHKIQSEGTYNNDFEGGAAEAAKRARVWLKEKGFTAVDKTKEPPVVLPGSGAPKDGGNTPSKKDEPYDEAKEQAAALADEIKARGDLSGKRTTR
jgi:hypothetical protein